MSRWWTERGLPLAAGLSIAALVFFAVRWARGAGLLIGVEAGVYDHWVKRLPKAAASPCVIVYVSEDDIRAWQQYPISDRKMAELLEKLQGMKPRVIGVDIYRDIYAPDIHEPDPKGDRVALAKQLAAQEPLVVSGYLLDTSGTGVPPPPEVAKDDDRIGYVNVDTSDPDDTRRQALLFMSESRNPDAARYALGTRLAEAYMDDDERAARIAALPVVRPGDLFYAGRQNPVIATAAGTRRKASPPLIGTSVLLDFRGPATFPKYDVEQVLADDFDPALVRDKIVLVGVITGSIKDYLATPIDPRLPGVEIHAQICDQLLRQTAGEPPLATAAAGVDATWLLAWCLAGWVIGWFLRVPWQIVLALAALVAVVWWVGWAMLLRHTFLAVVPPALGGCVTAALVTSYQSFRERADRRVMNGLVDRMMSPRIAATLWARRGELLESGHLKPQVAEATVLFSDLQGFTEMSDHLDAAVLLKWLNSYFQAMAGLVEAHGGVVNKYVGDAVMAVFGPPLESVGEDAARTNAANAVACALAMRDGLAELRTLWREKLAAEPGWTAAEARQLAGAIDGLGAGRPCIRIGLCSGTLIAGSLGSRDRLEYTVLGGTVNLASRLEGWDKGRMEAAVAPGGCRILMNGRARALVDGSYVCSHLGTHAIKGIDERVDIYAVLGRTARETSDAKRD